MKTMALEYTPGARLFAAELMVTFTVLLVPPLSVPRSGVSVTQGGAAPTTQLMGDSPLFLSV